MKHCLTFILCTDCTSGPVEDKYHFLLECFLLKSIKTSIYSCFLYHETKYAQTYIMVQIKK